MGIEKNDLVKIFYSYAHEDKDWLEELDKQLRGDDHSSYWDDRNIIPGAVWSNEIDEHLNKADIILLLISPYFKGSHYCTIVEMPRALERKRNGEAEVIPILVRSTHWNNPPYKHLQMVPHDTAGVSKPIDLWVNKYEVCAIVAAEIHRTIKSIMNKPKLLEVLVGDGDRLTSIGKYEDAYSAYNRALGLSPRNALLFEKLGNACLYLQKFTEALEAYEKALNIDENNVRFWRGKSDALLALDRAKDAKDALHQAIKHDPKNAFIYKEYGDILIRVDMVQEALEAYSKAIELNSKYGLAYAARAKVRKRMAEQLIDLVKKDQAKARELGISENGA
jgi:tetratricopeptide (TPR) repeat protein